VAYAQAGYAWLMRVMRRWVDGWVTASQVPPSLTVALACLMRSCCQVSSPSERGLQGAANGKRRLDACMRGQQRIRMKPRQTRLVKSQTAFSDTHLHCVALFTWTINRQSRSASRSGPTRLLNR
jgi:hypothetical protein